MDPTAPAATPADALALFGLLSWFLAGLGVAIPFRFAAGFFLAGVGRHRGWGWVVLLGILGALAGGMAATLSGFGGLAAFDPRSFLLALVGALFVLLLDRWVTS